MDLIPNEGVRYIAEHRETLSDGEALVDSLQR